MLPITSGSAHKQYKGVAPLSSSEPPNFTNANPNVSGIWKCHKGLEKMKTFGGWMWPAHPELCRHRPGFMQRLR